MASTGAATERARKVRDAQAIATAELLAAADAWGENVEKGRVGAPGVGDVLRLRAILCGAAQAYHAATREAESLLVQGDRAPASVDDGAGVAPYRPRDDGGASPVVGMLLCLGLTVAVFGSCVWVAAWCPSCETRAAPGLFGGSWADESRAHLVANGDGSTSSCAPLLYLHNGYARLSGTEACSLVSIKLDPTLPAGASP